MAAAGATSSRSRPICGPASAWCAAARARRWSATRKTVAERLREYQALGIETVIASGYPHLEEAYKVAELLFPELGIGQAPQLAHGTAPGEFGVGAFKPAIAARMKRRRPLTPRRRPHPFLDEQRPISPMSESRQRSSDREAAPDGAL